MGVLHENKGRYRLSKVFFGKLFVECRLAEDPAQPWWKRTWAVESDEGKVLRQFLLAVELNTHVEHGKCLFVYVGPFMFAGAIL